MNCEKCKNLIERHIDGTISDKDFAELKAHTDTCQSCREEFSRCARLSETIQQAFSSQTAAEQARRSVIARLSEQADQWRQPTRPSAAWLAGKRAAIAASILLAAGLLLGFALGRAGIVKPAGAPRTPQVPIRLGRLEGTVLVKHEGCDVWQALRAGSGIYLGDRFHSTAKSGFVLELQNESTIEVNQNSMLVLRSYNGETQFFLEHGECTASLESPHGRFFISTPHGRVEALGTEFTVTVTDD